MNEKNKEAFLSKVVTVAPEEVSNQFLIFPNLGPAEKSPKKVSIHKASVPTVSSDDSTAESAPSGLSKSAVKLLVHAANVLLCFISKRYEDLGFVLAEGTAALKELVAGGYVRLRRIPRLGRGAPYQAMEVLKAGKTLLEEMGIQLEARVSKGDFLHDLYCRWIGRWAELNQFRYRFEQGWGNKFFDLGLESPTGEIIGVEVVLSGSVSWNMAQLVKAMSVVGLTAVYVVCEDKRLKERLEKEFDTSDLSHEIKAKVKFFQCAEFIQPCLKD
jgi:hypothetical protein